ncbi:MAG TPA: phosphatase [Acidimicrobiia bacterium]|nr:phosphatase [Acidimicrobiia bacterium]
MDSHRFVPGPPRVHVRRKHQRIVRTTREVGSIIDRPDTESMTLIEELVSMGIAGRKTAISTQALRDTIGQLARRNPEFTMGINGKYFLHALDAGSIEQGVEEVFGVDTTQATVTIDPEMCAVALDEAFDQISDAAYKGARMIFASSRPASTLPLLIELARLSSGAGAQILDSYDNTRPFIADGRKGRCFTWISSVGVMSDNGSLLSTNDAKAADDLFFHLPRPDLVIADHIFAGASLTNGLPTIALTGLDSLAVAIATIPEKNCTAIPMSLNQPSTHYGVVANYAKSYFSKS